jgi:hypothetical protein
MSTLFLTNLLKHFRRPLTDKPLSDLIFIILNDGTENGLTPYVHTHNVSLLILQNGLYKH